MGKTKDSELGALHVSRLTEPGHHFVGGVSGLALQITKSGARSWVLRTMIGGKRREMGLGGYPSVTLSAAKESARVARDKIRNGIDPIEESRKLKSALAASRAAALTFEQCAAAFIAAKEPEWKNAKHGEQWRNTLATYAYPIIGKTLVRDVNTAHVMRILEPIWTTKTETATRLRGRIENVLDWAGAREYRPKVDNPARWRGHLNKLLPQPSKIAEVEHHKALDYEEVGSFMAELRQKEGMGAKALEFLILTAVRSGEVRLATWDEINFDKRIWTIPAGRMKAGKEHNVPLSDAAIALLKALPRIDGSNYLFPNTKGAPLSDMTLTQVLRRMGKDISVHGFRSTFTDWASEETNILPVVSDMALAHAIDDKVKAAYRRGELLRKRTLMMKRWEKYCGKVSQQRP